jgi:hypothetical protein
MDTLKDMASDGNSPLLYSYGEALLAAYVSGPKNDSNDAILSSEAGRQDSKPDLLVPIPSQA